MTVIPGYFELSPEQRRFQALLERYPRLKSYWNFKTRECDFAALQRDMGVLSHGEQLIASFLMSVWNGNDEENFPLMDAVKTLDDENLEPIREWLNEPFFP